MNRSTGSVLTIAAALLAALWWSSLPGSADPPGARPGPARLLQILPEQALAAAELRNPGELAVSFERYRGLAAAISGWIDPSCVGAYFPPRLEGPALVAAFPGDAGALPAAALVLPAGGAADLESAGCFPRPPGLTLGSFSERGADWIASEETIDALRELAHGATPGAFIDRARVLDGLERLPRQASVRGWVNTAALRGWLLRQARALEGTPSGALASLMLLDASALDLLAGQRTLFADGFTGALRASWRQRYLPAELLDALDSADVVSATPTGTGPFVSATGSLPAPLGQTLPAASNDARPASSEAAPPGLAEDTLLVARFPTDAAAIVPWLRYAAALEPRGPLRNAPFYLEEFREKTGLDPARELPRAFGRRAAAFIFRGEGLPAPALVLETGDAEAARELIRDGLEFLRGHQRSRTLGLAVPSVWSEPLSGGELFGIKLGPAQLLVRVDDELIAVAGDPTSLGRARRTAVASGLGDAADGRAGSGTAPQVGDHASSGTWAADPSRERQLHSCTLWLRPAQLLAELADAGLDPGDEVTRELARSLDVISLRGLMTRDDAAGTIDLTASGEVRYRR